MSFMEGEKRPGPKGQKGKAAGKSTGKTSVKNRLYQPTIHSNLDPKCVYDLSKKLYRIEYPGCVKNLDEALKTLGGLSAIENCVDDNRNKLELRFHPQNVYNRGCVADADPSPGILIKVKEKASNEKLDPDDCPYDYEVVGVTSQNFTFNNMCDFQYLPIVPKDLNETSESEVEYVYDQILPNKIPDMEWFVKKESKEQQKFCIPSAFARFDGTQGLYLKAGEKYDSYVRPDVSQNITNAAISSKPKRKRALPIKQISQFIDFTKYISKVPDQPVELCMNLVHEKSMEKECRVVQEVFEERPIWTKVAVEYRTRLRKEHLKILLPAVAYFCNVGPWRNCWIRLGYNPLEDINSRIYQILDFRIRATQGLKLKINAKRGRSKLFFGPSKKGGYRELLEPESLPAVEENYFILRPNSIPPARQMMYQFSDILIPEVQEMLSRLPKLQTNVRYSGKYGWLPANFIEQCREIANQYVLNTVQEILLEDNTGFTNVPETPEASEQVKTQNVLLFASQMLTNIRKGVSNLQEIGESSKASDNTGGDLINLVEGDDEELDQIDAYEFVNSIPAHIPENSDEDSDMEIDAEALEEVNQMVMGIREEDDVNVVAGFLKDL